MNEERDLTNVEQVVLDLKFLYQDQWRGKSQWYWMWRLLQEVGELLFSLLGLHDDPPEWELGQIASITMNWMEKNYEGRSFE